MHQMYHLFGETAYMPAGGAGRARRRNAIPLVGVHCRVPEGTRTRASSTADALGITMGQYVELLIERDEIDGAGRPMWADEVFPSAHNPLPGMERHDAA